MIHNCRYIISAGLAIAIPMGAAAAESQLSTVTIMGKTFYTYVAKKGESLFGIANHFGWDPQILTNTNRELETPLQKGALVYYPAPKGTKIRKGKNEKDGVSAESALAHDAKEVSSSVHTQLTSSPSSSSSSASATSGAAEESASTAEEYYFATTETTDDSAPLTVVSTDVDLNPEADEVHDGVLYHTVQSGESLYGIARTYATTVEDIYKMNPGLSYQNPEPGETIRLRTGSVTENARPTMVKERQLTGLTTYKVRRGDTWASVAEAKGISADLLKEANPDKGKLRRGDVITIPDVETVEVERLVVTQDPRETSEEGLRELYNEVHALNSKIYDADGNISPRAISVAIVLSNPESNRDMEFARGAILAVSDMKAQSFPTRLTVIDGSQSATEVTGALEGFAPTVVLTTAERDLPAYLTDYVKENSRHLINAFDVRNEAYLKNPAMVQYLAPTSYFNDEAAQYITDTYGGYELIIGGKLDGNDTMGEAILRAKVAATDAMPQEVVIDEIAQLTLPAEDGNYLIYATPAGKEDVKSMLDKVGSLRERYPLADIRVIGRPSWITMVEALRHTFDDNRVILPSRFYFDADDQASRKFIDGYRSLFGHTPMKSYPVYSATAYDILTYFLPNISSTQGDFNADFEDRPTLQSPISLQRVNNWGGFVNPCVCVVEFQPFGGVKKTILNADE